MKASEIQVGGSHYKDMPYQISKFIADMGFNFHQGCILKYVCRFDKKNGLEDLKKAYHYTQLIDEDKPIYEARAFFADYVERFISENKLSRDLILNLVLALIECNTNNMRAIINSIIETNYGK